jgi:hypothetical protein
VKQCRCRYIIDKLPDYQVFVNDNKQYPEKLVALYRLLPETKFHILAHCGEYQKMDSVIYSRRSLLVRSWLYEVTRGQNPRPLYQVVGSIRNNIHVKRHIFAIEENPGFHKRYPREEDKRFMVLSDMQKVWPSFFIGGEHSTKDISVGKESSNKGESSSDSE